MTAPESAARDAVHEGDASLTHDRFQTAAAFCRAAVAAHRVGDAANRREASEDHLAAAARALIELADLDAGKALGVALRPDPEVERALWTVACYQIGDLIPCHLDDFNDAVHAVRALANCEDASHVAAELIASAGTGVRWTALVRVGERVSFQLASEDSASSGSGAQAGALDRALEHWTARLEGWAKHDGGDALGESPEPEARTSSGDEALGASMSELTSTLQGVLAAINRQEQRLERLISRFDSMERRLAYLVDLIRDAAKSTASTDEHVPDPATARGACER
jgi:hypothetical protein